MASNSAAALPPSDTDDIRRIDAGDLYWALAEGWHDFTAKRGDLIVAGLLYPLICFIAIFATLNQPLLPLMFPLVAGLSIAGPAAASGFYELARRRETGIEASWWHFLDPLRGRSRAPLAVLTIILAALFIGWLGTAYAIYLETLGRTGPMRLADGFARLFSTREGWELIVFGNAAGLGFAIVTLIVSLVSFPMVVDRPVDAWTAVHTSIRAASRNPGAVLRWGIMVAALLVLGTLPFAIGLAVVLPWLGYATWHLYTRLVIR